MLIASIHQPQYLPWLGYFDKIHQSDIFILHDDINFKKNDWQNRNKIKTTKGWEWLTIPLNYRFKRPIEKTPINNTINWQEKHLNKIKLNYKDSYHYNYLIDECEKFYAGNWEMLGPCNIDFILTCIRLLSIQTKIVLASTLNIKSTGTQKIIDLCRAVNAEAYLTDIHPKTNNDLLLLKKWGIQTIYQDYKHPIYNQLNQNKKNPGFVSHLSIIDLLFNHGPESSNILFDNTNQYT